MQYVLRRGTAKNKSRKAVPVSGDGRTYQGGQKGAKVMPGTKKEKSFDARHGAVTSAVKYINKRRRDGTLKFGQKFVLPARFRK